MKRMPIDRLDRGKTITVATHSWQDGCAEIYAMITDHEVTGDGAAAMAKAHEEEYLAVVDDL